MTPGQVLWALRVAMWAALALGAWYVKAKYDELVLLREAHEQTVQELATLRGQFDKYDATLEAKVREEFDRRTRRANINRGLDNAAQTDDVARDYLGERIPDSVRRAYRAGAAGAAEGGDPARADAD